MSTSSTDTEVYNFRSPKSLTTPDGGGGNSQTEHAKIGTAVPYFPKVPFEASHLSFGNANIVSNSVEPATFSPGGFQAELSLFSIQNKGRWF